MMPIIRFHDARLNFMHDYDFVAQLYDYDYDS